MKQMAYTIIAVILIGFTAEQAFATSTVDPYIELRGRHDHIARYYSNQATRVGRFPGKLVCAYDIVAPVPSNPQLCPVSGDNQVFALELEQGPVYPLQALTRQMIDRIRFEGLMNSEVFIIGKYYPTTGSILVADILPATQ